MSVSNPPAGFHTVTPYLLLRDVNGFLEFVKKAFNAQVTENIYALDGTTTFHAQVKIGDSMLMVGDPRTMESQPAGFFVYIDDCDAMTKQAEAAGGKVTMPATDMSYGVRHSGVKDPWGNMWWIATHIEVVTSEELQRRSDVEMRRRQAT